MCRAITWLGYALLAIGLLLVPPLSDFLPVDLWAQLGGLFSSTPRPYHFRIVPSDDGPAMIAGAVLIAIGLVLIVWPRLRSKHSHRG